MDGQGRMRKLFGMLAEKLVAKESLNNIELEKERESICRSCEYFDEKNIMCTECGCLLDIKWKTKVNRVKGTVNEFEQTHCVHGKWNDSHIAEFYKIKRKKR